jgi:membrane glycosyltransferase
MFVKNNTMVALLLTITTLSYAGAPLWSFTLLTTTTLSVSSNGIAIVQYTDTA